MKEATARIKINRLLEAAGWRFFPEGGAHANIRLEPSVTIKSTDLDALGDNFDKTQKGFVDFLLLDAKGFPFIVLEAKAEDKNPLAAKEQARKYARSQNCRFVILSNGNLHYFWDLERGNPYIITSFPTPDSVTGYQKVTPNPQRLIAAQAGDDYIVLTQRPNYQAEAGWQNETERPGYIQANKLRFLRPYQLKAIHSLQAVVRDGKDRFLFEMATGTGKTLTAAAVVKLFLRSGNASYLRRKRLVVSRLGWLDYSEAQRRQALEVIDRFAEKGTVDELGLGTVRDALSDLLFPGLSVLHTRARYFLFVPWMYQDLEFRRTSSADAGKKARAQEIKLIYALADSTDPRGTIGIEAREKLKRFPSSVYWQGLGRWGVRHYQGAEPQYRRWLDRYYRLVDAEEVAPSGEDEDSRVPPNWHPGIPDPPDDFPDKADFALTRGEAEYLLDRVEQRAPGAFLAHLLRDGKRNEGVAFAWEHPIVGRLPERNQAILHHARLFSELTHGGPLLYNLLLAELQNLNDRTEHYREELRGWAVVVEKQLPAANRWDRQDFWLTVTRTGARVSPGTRAFIDQWINLTMQPGVAGRIADHEQAREMVAARERAIKGGMARVDNQRALELWTGASGTGQLDFRWGQIQLLIDDILRGLGR